MQKILNILKQTIPLLKSRVVYILIGLLILVITLDLLFPLPNLKPYSKIVYAKDGSLLTTYLSSDDKWRMRTKLSDVSPELINAVLEKEDNWFYWHFGVNPVSLVRALFQNITSNKRVSGASTITMQVARMLEHDKRTYTKKFWEILRAFQLELHYSKNEILEIYLSMLPYGGNIEGVKSASYIYFNRPPNKLSLSQAILLTVIPNDPNSLRLDKDANKALKVRNVWIRKFSEKKTFKSRDLQDALEEPVSINRFQMRNNAPHFCQFVSQKTPEDEVNTFLDLAIQKTAEKLLLNHVHKVKSRGVTNGSVLIIDNKTNSVVGYCGSADFYDYAASGQVNGIIALRSPGSTLKPALYTLAFSYGILTPEMKLLDVPTEFGSYEPENFDLKSNGEVSASYALINSLNIPAVRLIQQIGLDKFISLLIKTGFTDIEKQKKSLGLSLILGGCGVRLEQLTRFFSVFAHNGKLYPINYLNNSPLNENSGEQIFHPGSVFLINQILSGNERPDFPIEFLYTTNLPKIAWKTGTSYGKRDAWAVGYNPDYTIGVWMGNFNGEGSPELSGAEMAAPLLFELFNTIDYKPKKNWFDKPNEVWDREVCAETGLLPTESCKSIIRDYFILKVSPNTKCNLYKSLYVNNAENIQYCSECLPDSGYQKIDYPFYDPELILWLIKNKTQFKRPPPHNPFCQAKRSGPGPKIISPSADYEYFIEEKSNQQLLLQAVSDPSVKTHYWYINNEFYKQGKPGDRIFYKPSKGGLKITCLDDLGRKMSIQTKVISY